LAASGRTTATDHPRQPSAGLHKGAHEAG
jgi:hypothetical protein